MNVFKGYISDLDGTLCDTRLANVTAYRLAFADVGLAFDEDLYHQHFGLRFSEMMAAVVPDASRQELDRIAEMKSAHYAQNMHLIKVNEELVRLLRHVHSNGAQTGIATTARKRNATAILEHFGLTALFDITVYGEDVTHAKPDPECYSSVIEKMQLKAEECLIFEDSDIGIRAAVASGAYTIKVTI